jgi:hypothetical protein
MAALKKILKNLTSPASNIEISETGITILPTEDYTIDPVNYLYWGKPETITELTPYLNSGDIVVNDGTNDLPVAEAIRFLEYADRIQVSETGVQKGNVVKGIDFDGDAVVTDNGDGTVTVVVGTGGVVKGKLYDFSFNNVGRTSNKWLEFASSSAPSNDNPLVGPYDSDMIALTYSNTSNDSGTDAEIYKNGVLFYTWQIRNKRTAWKTDLPLLSLNQGDRISVFFKKVAGQGDPQSPVMDLYFSVTSHNEAEGGTQTGV